MDNYKNKSDKEYKKCQKLIKEIFTDSFYFVHSTLNLKSLKSILKDKMIKTGEHSPVRRLAGWEAQPYVFGNIQFDDINNIKIPMGLSLILHPKIIFDMKIIFNDA